MLAYKCLYRNLHRVNCNGLKSHKIRYKSRGNNPIKPFQVQFTCVRPVFLLVTSSVFWKCAQRSKVIVRGYGNCFYRAITLWRDETSDEKHEEIGRLSSALTEKISEGFSAATLLFQLCEGTCYKEKQDHRHLGIFSCTSLPKRSICTFSTSQKKGVYF